MTNSVRTCLGLLAPLLLSACAVAPRPDAGMQPLDVSAPPWSEPTAQKIMIKGRGWPAPLEANAALSSERNLRKALEAYGDFPKKRTLRELIAEIEAENERPGGRVPAMTGVGGVLGHAFLEASKRTLGSPHFDTTHTVVLSVTGQITDYAFMENGNTGQGNGRLEVITQVTSIKVPHGQGTPTPQTASYRWKLRVNNNGFRIVPKGAIPNDPFPDTIEFTPEAIAEINARGFMFKLWAEGLDIEIVEVARKAGASPNFAVLSENNPKYAHLYAEISENCIDILFVDRPPPTLGDMQPPLYCLGRCDDPLIVNTGI